MDFSVMGKGSPKLEEPSGPYAVPGEGAGDAAVAGGAVPPPPPPPEDYAAPSGPSDLPKPTSGHCNQCGQRNIIFNDDGTGKCPDCGHAFYWDKTREPKY